MAAIRGVTRSVTNALTIAPKAAPMTTATARSTTLPRSRNALNPLNLNLLAGGPIRPSNRPPYGTDFRPPLLRFRIRIPAFRRGSGGALGDMRAGKLRAMSLRRPGNLKWLQPGLHIKRWLGLAGVSVFGLALGAAYT